VYDLRDGELLAVKTVLRAALRANRSWQAIRPILNFSALPYVSDSVRGDAKMRKARIVFGAAVVLGFVDIRRDLAV
jgi:hypothetical protein